MILYTLNCHNNYCQTFKGYATDYPSFLIFLVKIKNCYINKFNINLWDPKYSCFKLNIFVWKWTFEIY